MKKTLLFACCAFALCSCSNGVAGSTSHPSGSANQPTWTITFDSNGGTPVSPVEVANGEKAQKPDDPVKEGATFDAWYIDEVCATPFDWDTEITSDWTLYAGYEEESSSDEPSSEESSEQSSSEESSDPEPEPFTIYFKDASWWNQLTASTRILINGETGLGQEMEHLRYCLVDYGVGYNYWSYTFDDISEVEAVSFLRAGLTDGVLSDWGAQTVTVDLSDRGEANMYDISGSSASWKGDGNYATGVWGTYDPNDMGNEDLDMTGYIVGSGSFATAEWTPEGGIELELNPNNPNELMGLRIEFEAGDVFKINWRSNWTGYSKIKDESPIKSTHFQAGEGDNIVVTQSGTFDMYLDMGVDPNEDAKSLYIALSGAE